MSTKLLLSYLFPDGPYFGGKTVGFQAHYFAIRHVFMMETIQNIAKINPEPKLLEVGSWTGSSAFTWCEAITKFCSEKGEILCVDPWKPYFDDKDVLKADDYQNMNNVAALDLSYHLFLHNIQFAAAGAQINHFRGTSSDVLSYLSPDSFDLIYLDGSHYLEDVRFDLTQADKLLKDGGILCGDDLELKGDECDLDFAKSHPVSDFIKDPKTGISFHPGVTVAVHEMFPEVSSYHGYWLMQKTDGKYKPVYLTPPLSLIPSHFSQEIKAIILERLGTYLDKKNNGIHKALLSTSY